MAMRPVERLLATARAEIGYIEKDTNAQLDDKTANAGDGNWNKYARDLDALGVVYNGKKNGYAWCDIYTDWCFIQTFGLELGLKLLVLRGGITRNEGGQGFIRTAVARGKGQRKGQRRTGTPGKSHDVEHAGDYEH